MTQLWRYSLIFLCSLVVFLIITLPAGVVVKQLTLPKNIHYQSVDGTVWHPVINKVQLEDISLSTIELQLSPWSLLSVNPTITAKIGRDFLVEPEGQLTIDQLLDQGRLTNLSAKLAANVIAERLTLPIKIKAAGLVTLTVEQWQGFISSDQSRLCSTLSGHINWNNAAVTAYQQTIELGKFTANLSCENGQIHAQVLDNNRLGLSADIYLNKQGKITGDGFIKPNANMPKELAPLLPMLGRQDNQGRYRLQF
jgi:general secretion pathway protein N